MISDNYTLGGLPYKALPAGSEEDTSNPIDSLELTAERIRVKADDTNDLVGSIVPLFVFLKETYDTLPNFIRVLSIDENFSTMGWNYVCKVVEYALALKKKDSPERISRLRDGVTDGIPTSTFKAAEPLGPEVVAKREAALDSVFEELGIFGADLDLNYHFVTPLFADPAAYKMFISKMF